MVGSLPIQGCQRARAGCLIVLTVTAIRETCTRDGINGPWDMTSVDFGDVAVLFVTNVLNGTVAAGVSRAPGTVVRCSDRGGAAAVGGRSARIGSGFAEHRSGSARRRTDRDRLGANGTLYVADTVANRIAAIPDALFRVSTPAAARRQQGRELLAPLGLTVAPGGNILTVNGGNGNLVETTPSGAQVAVRALDTSGSPPGAGALFGLAVKPHHRAVYFVDDATNTFELLH